MQVESLSIADVKLITFDRYDDERGFFCERWSAPKFKALGLDITFAQDNHSRSHPGVLRGIHYQHTPAQGKLVGVIRGKIFDVAVDLRPESPTLGQHVAVELDAETPQLLWIPEGFGHGFCVLGDEVAEVTYKASGAFNAAGEGGIACDDRDLAIAWPLAAPILSHRDKNHESFAEYKKRMKA